MSELTVNQNSPSTPPDAPRQVPNTAKSAWEKPKLEDVSEQVMAQPYIRFT
jgi:hypothetical protein